MGLTETARIGRHEAIAPAVAPLTELAKQPYGGMAAGIPPLQQDDLIRVQQTLPAVTPPFPPRKRGGLEIALHGTQTDPDLLRNGAAGPPLAVEGPDLFIDGLPACLALGRALLSGSGRVGGWHRHRDRPIGQRHGLLAHQVIDGIKGLPMRGEDLVQSFPEILQQMKTPEQKSLLEALSRETGRSIPSLIAQALNLLCEMYAKPPSALAQE